jgi:hypothetical protein
MWFNGKIPVWRLQEYLFADTFHLICHQLLFFESAYVLNHRIGKCNVECFVAELFHSPCIPCNRYKPGKFHIIVSDIEYCNVYVFLPGKAHAFPEKGCSTHINDFKRARHGFNQLKKELETLLS